MSAFETRLLSSSLEERWQTYNMRLKACLEETGSESIHEFRVAARRLFSIIELIRAISPSRELQRLQRELRNQLNDLDKISDVQVMIAQISELGEQEPEASSFLRHLQKREKRLLSKASKYLHSLDEQKLNKQTRLINKLRESSFTSRQGLHAALMKTLDDAFKVALERYRAIDPAQTATIHRLRIAFRKFRYMVEIVHPALRAYPPETLAAMREYQRAMGKIQDLETISNYIEKYAQTHKRFDGNFLSPHYQEKCAQAVISFSAQMANICNFWRPSRTAPFPWTKKRRPLPACSQRPSAQEETPGQPDQSHHQEQGQ